MKFPSKATIEQYRREYPVGCRVELVQWTTHRLLRKAREELYEGLTILETSSFGGTTAVA